MTKLSFRTGNAKLTKKTNTFSLPAGKACPAAKDCKSMAIEGDDGKRTIQDGKDCQFRCFAASQEVCPNTFKARKRNFDLLLEARTATAMVDLIEASLLKPHDAERVHVSGDFFNQVYFDAWMEVACRNPDRCFYAYTKSIPFWVDRLNDIPENFELNASYGGHHDSLIEKHGLKSARVVFSEQEAIDLGLEIDHDDSLAMKPGPSFALLLHGTQPKGSEAAKAKKALGGKGGYSAKKKG